MVPRSGACCAACPYQTLKSETLEVREGRAVLPPCGTVLPIMHQTVQLCGTRVVCRRVISIKLSQIWLEFLASIEDRGLYSRFQGSLGPASRVH